MSFSCAVTGTAEDNNGLLKWQITSPELLDALTGAAGQVAVLELSIDGTRLGEGPFQRVDAQALATSLPRDITLLGKLRTARELRLTVAGSAASVTMPLEGLGTALTEMERFCDTPVPPTATGPDMAAAPAPAVPRPALAVAVTPISPAQLGGVMWDSKQISQKLFIEVVRRQPALLDEENVLLQWARLAFDQRKPQEMPNWSAVTRDHLARSIAAEPTGPFVIGQALSNPMTNNARHENGILKSGYANANSRPFSSDLGQFQISIPGMPAISVRAKSQFDVSSLSVDAVTAQRLIDGANDMRLGVVVQIDEMDVVGTPQTGMRASAAGSVRFAGLFETSQSAKRDSIDPNRLVAVFPPTPIDIPGTGLAASAMALGIPMYQGAVLEGTRWTNSSDQPEAAILARLAALKRDPPGALSDELRSYVFLQLATQAERDAVIDPFFLMGNSGNRLAFAEHVDEFERAELLDRIDTLLWPHVRDRLPDVPFNVIALTMVSLGEYDRVQGGFPIHADLSSLGLAGAGDFPAFKAIPELLSLRVEQARELVGYLEAINGPGSRQVMLVARYRIEDVGPITWEERRLPQLTATPLSLSLHARQTLAPGDNPLDQKFMEFDIAEFRGPVRPVASPETMAFWDAIDEPARNTTDDIALAALKVSESAEHAAFLAEDMQAVRAANEFDRQAVVDRMRSEIEAMYKPDALLLDGMITLGDFDPQRQGFPVAGFNFEHVQGPVGLRVPQIELVNPETVSWIVPDEALARQIAASSRNGYNQLRFTAWLDPELSQLEQGRAKVYARITRIVMRAPMDNGSGYPSAYMEILPEAAPEKSGTALAEKLLLEPPSAVVLDQEYLDLLMVRDADTDLSEATYARMMEDRRMREVAAAGATYALAWGPFFETPEAVLNPVQYRVKLAEFITWTKARAEMLPTAVYVQTQGNGSLPSGLQCWFLTPPTTQYTAQNMPEGLVRKLEEFRYSQHDVGLDAFRRAATGFVSQWPTRYYAIYGSPALGAAGQRADHSASQCQRGARGSAERERMEGAQVWNALVSVDGAYRGPADSNPAQSDTYFYRDYGILSVDRTAEDTMTLSLSVTRTERVQITSDAGVFVYNPVELLDESAMPARPATIDVLGLKPGAPWGSARAAAAERLGAGSVFESNGPPATFRMATRNTLMGPQPEFEAFRNGHFFFDPVRKEALALIREAERDPEHVLAVGSYRTFAEGDISAEALIGSLLRKYGEAPLIEEDTALHGPRPAKTLTWGMKPGCLPNMRDEVRPDFSSETGRMDVRPLQDMARAFKAPSLTYSGTESLIFERCEPLIWAFVGQDAQDVLHLIVWSLDLALLNEVAKRPDLKAIGAGGNSSEALIEKAADIDL